jgi:RimJ/RimL family protein N-acetyltransferase
MSQVQLLLDDGRRVTFRPIHGDDTPALMAMHDRLSADSVRRRFLGVLPHLTLAQAERFTHVDGERRLAVVAEADDGQLVAVGRYDRLPDTSSAELAVVVVDDFQHHGIGTALVSTLHGAALEHGITRFTADVATDNEPMLAAVHDAGLTFTATYDCGVATLDIPLPRRDVDDVP